MTQKEKKCNIQTSIIIVLLIIIAILSFFIGKNYDKITNINNINNSSETNNNSSEIKKEIKITILDDKRCILCDTDNFIKQIKQIPELAWAKFDKKDFWEKWVEELLKYNKIEKLPAIIFNTNQINSNINPYLKEIPSKQYILQMWSNFDPFAKRTKKWFLKMEKQIFEKIKTNSYIKGNQEAKITWIEFSDLQCPFCSKIHIDWTPKKLNEKYWEKINKIFNHFPLEFHSNAQKWAEILECIWEQKGSEAFYKIIETSFYWRDLQNQQDHIKKSWKEFLTQEAIKLWINKQKLEKCLENSTYKEKVWEQQKIWNEVFWITWTPWNVLINNETLEYQVMSWAYPIEIFEKVIDKLIK